MKILTEREQNLVKQVELELAKLEESHKKELESIVIESKKDSISETRMTAKINLANELYQARINELQDELSVIKNDISIPRLT